MPKKPSLPDMDALFSSKRALQGDTEIRRQEGKETERSGKVKVSFYLTPPPRNAIEAARFELRTKRNLPVTNSELAEVALKCSSSGRSETTGSPANGGVSSR